jgi:hypothetical protein
MTTPVISSEIEDWWTSDQSAEDSMATGIICDIFYQWMVKVSPYRK